MVSFARGLFCLVLVRSVVPVLAPAPRGIDVSRQQPPRKIALKGPAVPAKLVKQIVRVTSRLGQLHQSDEPIGGRREQRVRRVAR